jgi:hypothetical protein
MNTPPPLEIVEGVAWSECLTLLVAESGAGKTFLALDCAAAVSDGASWHGRTVRAGSVAYVSFEGDALGLRLRALQEAGRQLEHLHIIQAREPISPLLTREGERRSIGELAVASALTTLSAELEEARKPPLLLTFFDTVRASMTGPEESSEHAAAYLRAARRLIASVPGAGAVLVHHAGWQDGEQQRRRERGSSAWRGNCDATLYLETVGDYDRARREMRLVLRTLKVRDAERPAHLHLVRRTVDLLERDRRGQPVTSCVIEPDRRSREDRQAEAAAVLSQEQQVLDGTVLRAIAEQPDVTTSQDRIRQLLGLRRGLVQDALARLIGGGLILPGRQRQPYQLTDAGRELLAASRPESARVSPPVGPSRPPVAPLWGHGAYSESPRVSPDGAQTATSQP